MVKKSVKKYFFYFALTFILCTCNDPIFYTISREVKPLKPRISGAPTNFAVYDNCMYVASGSILYAYKGVWSSAAQPGGVILQVAATGTHLYALCSTDKNVDGSTVIKRFDTANSWTEMGGAGYGKIHNIFAAGSCLFIMATSYIDKTNIYYTIFYIDGSGTIKPLLFTDGTAQNNTGELKGAAFDGTSYYLPTWDRGVYKTNNPGVGAALIPSIFNFTGIINLKDTGNTIFLIDRNGNGYTVNTSIIPSVSMNKLSTGALAIWVNPYNTSQRLLLAGRQDSLSYSYSSGYTYGYMEAELGTSGITSGFIEPGLKVPTSVEYGQNDRFLSTIGKYAVNYLFQPPAATDSNMILFASTQKNGVWSYRVRGGIPQWNSEE